jgi:hypothetical protein
VRIRSCELPMVEPEEVRCLTERPRSRAAATRGGLVLRRISTGQDLRNRRRATRKSASAPRWMNFRYPRMGYGKGWMGGIWW